MNLASSWGLFSSCSPSIIGLRSLNAMPLPMPYSICLDTVIWYIFSFLSGLADAIYLHNLTGQEIHQLLCKKKKKKSWISCTSFKSFPYWFQWVPCPLGLVLQDLVNDTSTFTLSTILMSLYRLYLWSSRSSAFVSPHWRVLAVLVSPQKTATPSLWSFLLLFSVPSVNPLHPSWDVEVRTVYQTQGGWGFV